MRLLLETKANTIFEQINDIFMDKNISPFMYAAKNSRILSGEEEGVFAWIAVNYLKGFFSDNEGMYCFFIMNVQFIMKYIMKYMNI